MKELLLSIAIGLGLALPAVGREPETRRIASRIFEAASYDPASATLTLTFANGARYEYYAVPKETWLDFIRIVNKGEYFVRQIRPRFAYSRVNPMSDVSRNGGPSPRSNRD